MVRPGISYCFLTSYYFSSYIQNTLTLTDTFIKFQLSVLFGSYRCKISSKKWDIIQTLQISTLLYGYILSDNVYQHMYIATNLQTCLLNMYLHIRCYFLFSEFLFIRLNYFVNILNQYSQ